MVELGAKAFRLILLQERQQRTDDEGVEDFSGWIGVRNVENGVSLYVAMPTLIEVEDDASVATLFQ